MKDRTKEKHGYYTVISLDESREYKRGQHKYWICECICGSQRSVRSTSLKSLKHCGCLPKQDLVGKTFGHIKILSFGGFDLRYNRKRPTWIGLCTKCNTEKVFLQQVLTSGQAKTCGKCKPKGKDHPRYNPNYDRFNRRDSTEYKEWCKKVYKRDKYSCQCCGKRGWINAHHKDGWNWCVERRFDVSNGITLCAGPGSCHNLFHEIYGVGNNTESQFIDFMRKYSYKVAKDVKDDKHYSRYKRTKRVGLRSGKGRKSQSEKARLRRLYRRGYRRPPSD